LILTNDSGIITYIILNGSAWILSWVTNGRIVPYDYDQSDYWSPRPAGGILPGWLKRLARGKRDFWREYDYDDQIEQGNRHHDSFPTSDQYTVSESLERKASAFGASGVLDTADFSTPAMARLRDSITIATKPVTGSSVSEKY
jgi:hypothetical protein